MITFSFLRDNRYGVFAIAFLSLFSTSLHAENLLSCSPSEERIKPLAICAAAMGGCSVVESFVEDSEEKKFLAGEACTAAVSQLTGEGYDVSDFLGNGILELLNNFSDKEMKSDDTGSQLLGFAGKVLVVGGKFYGFTKCVQAAKAKCRLNYAEGQRGKHSVPSSPVNTENSRYTGERGDRSTLVETEDTPINYVSHNENEIKTLIKGYYSALSRGDTETVRKIRPQQSNIYANHSFTIQDMQLASCSTLESCEVHVDTVATPKSNSKNEERWVVSVETIKQNGEWKIASIRGGDVYKAAVKTMREYYKALTNGDYSVASSKWAEPPEKLATLIDDTHIFEPQFHVTDYSTESVKINVSLTIRPKNRNKDSEGWKGHAILVNNDNNWEIALIKLHQLND